MDGTGLRVDLETNCFTSMSTVGRVFMNYVMNTTGLQILDAKVTTKQRTNGETNQSNQSQSSQENDTSRLDRMISGEILTNENSVEVNM